MYVHEGILFCIYISELILDPCAQFSSSCIGVLRWSLLHKAWRHWIRPMQRNSLLHTLAIVILLSPRLLRAIFWRDDHVIKHDTGHGRGGIPINNSRTLRRVVYQHVSQSYVRPLHGRRRCRAAFRERRPEQRACSLAVSLLCRTNPDRHLLRWLHRNVLIQNVGNLTRGGRIKGVAAFNVNTFERVMHPCVAKGDLCKLQKQWKGEKEKKQREKTKKNKKKRKKKERVNRSARKDPRCSASKGALQKLINSYCFSSNCDGA